MLEFKFNLSSKLYSLEELSINYTLEYLNDWLSYESELKYLFYFGESHSEDDLDLTNLSYPKCLEDIIALLRNNTLLNNDEKHYILSLFIEDAYVSINDGIASLHMKIDSEYKKQSVNTNIIQYLLNHIYNQCSIGIFKNGLIQPLNNEDKIQYGWNDEIGWSYRFLENNPVNIDTLYFSNFTFIQNNTNFILPKPIYISNYNLECYQISKYIDSINNDIHRYKKSISFLEKKKKELQKEKQSLYKNYRDCYITMIDNDTTKWSIK